MAEQLHTPDLPEQKPDMVRLTDNLAVAGGMVVRAGLTQARGYYPEGVATNVLGRSDVDRIVRAAEEWVNDPSETPVAFRHEREQWGKNYMHFYEATKGGITEDEVRSAGVSVEFGGPTERKEGIHVLPGYQPDVVTNIEQDSLLLGEPTQKLDALTDATNMALAAESVGSVHISGLDGGEKDLEFGSPTRDAAIQEAQRVLKEGGFLVWDGGTPKNHSTIIAGGFVPRKVEYFMSVLERADGTYRNPSLVVSGVYQKLPDGESDLHR